MASNITIEGARLVFRNFSGAEGKYNRAGDRNFTVFLDANDAEQMAKDGWNVKYLQPRDDQEEPQAILSVAVSYKGRPPKIMMVTSKGKTPVGEDMVDILDWAEIKTADLIINPYEWEVNGKTGIKAYLKSLYIVLEEDELDRKYIDVPDSASNSIVGESYEGDGDTPPF